MAEIMVVAEHRGGELRDLTLQMLGKACALGREHGSRTCAVLLGSDVEHLVDRLKDRADTVVVYDDPRLEHFDPARHAEVLTALIAGRAPLLTLLGHTPWSMDLAPALAARTGYPLATDCVDIVLDGGRPKVVRQVYSGKLFARMAFREAGGYLVTVRAGSFPAAEWGDRLAEVVHPATPALSGAVTREFLGYQETGKGEVDITQADLLVSVGRGIGEEDNIPAAKELAGLLGGTLSCSRPVVDKKWLPKYHQVGTSGKSVKPKVYLALGISGAFQHVAGISGAGTVIAVNRDKKAPIFRVADYGVVADVMDVITALKAELQKK
jgi:electron transfer flavoprotein alpha subunit